MDEIQAAIDASIRARRTLDVLGTQILAADPLATVVATAMRMQDATTAVLLDLQDRLNSEISR